MKVTVEITDQQISDLLCSAFEGGSNYWYQIVGDHPPNGEPSTWKSRSGFSHLDYPMNKGGWLRIKSLEEPERPEVKLDRNKIEQGLQKLASSKEYSSSFSEIIREDTDSSTGDVFLQFCCYGEVLYG